MQANEVSGGEGTGPYECPGRGSWAEALGDKQRRKLRGALWTSRAVGRPAPALPRSCPDHLCGLQGVTPSWEVLLKSYVFPEAIPDPSHRGICPQCAVVSVPSLAQSPHRWPVHSHVTVPVTVLLRDTNGEFPSPWHRTKACHGVSPLISMRNS